mgnify:CR=1 FL=1
MNDYPEEGSGQPRRSLPVVGWERGGQCREAIAVLGLSSPKVIEFVSEAFGCVCLVLRVFRFVAEWGARRGRWQTHQTVRKPAQRAERASRTVEVGGGRAPKARDGGNGLYGVPGEAGSSLAARSRLRTRWGAYRTLHHAKSTPYEGTGGRVKLSTSIWGGRGGVR